MSKPILIAGPCAVETEEQLAKTAQLLYEQLHSSRFQLRYFRAGVWKPRSNPNEFKGAGEKALPWLSKIQLQYGWPVCVEVATPEHIDLCEQHHIKVVWVGARTSVNPFIMDELADTLRNRDFTVLLKNPVIPDLKLWRGSIERFQNANVKAVMAVHRGFSEPGENVFRNAPLWEVPIELKVQYPDIPLICDASHIAGSKKYLQEISQIALDYSFDGLMLETHYRPAEALSDAAQQVTPEELITLLEQLNLKHPLTSPAEEKLRKQRTFIEHIDSQISTLLEKRMRAVDTIAQIKLEENLAIVDPKQFKKVISRYLKPGRYDEDYDEFINQFLEILHQASIKRQQKYE